MRDAALLSGKRGYKRTVALTPRKLLPALALIGTIKSLEPVIIENKRENQPTD